MAYTLRKPPRSSFMRTMFGMGDEATTASSSSMAPSPGFVGIPFIPIPTPQVTAEAPPQPAPSIPGYVLWGGALVLAYFVLKKR